MSTLTRTIMTDLAGGSYVSIDGTKVVPECITRFGAGTRVEIRRIGTEFAVMPISGSVLRIFGEETWLKEV